MLTPNRLVVLLLLGAPGFPAAAAERLLYSVGHEEGRGPGFTRTEIFALDPATGRRELVFTDAGLPVVLLPDRPSGIRSWVMGAAGNAVLARAAERRAFPGGWAESPAGIYELSTDGTNRARKVTDVLGEHPLRLLVCDPAGRRVAYLNENAGAPTLFVHDIASGRLLGRLSLAKVFLDCFARTLGWTADGARLFFALETGDVHVTSRASYARIGSYFMNEDGTRLERVPAAQVAPRQLHDHRSNPEMPGELLGELAGGRRLFLEYQWRARGDGRAENFLYAVDARGGNRRYHARSGTGSLYGLRLSPSRRLIAYTTENGARTEEQVWLLDLDTGKETALFALPYRPIKPPHLSLVGWLDR